MANWENINAVQRMQSYIETHLHEPITLRELADAAGYSPWHAAKLFKTLTGKSPFEYIRSVRLSRAAVQLREHKAKVVDVRLILSSIHMRVSHVRFQTPLA